MGTSDDPSDPRAAEILSFWFGDDPARPLAHSARWFERDDAFDAQVRERFAPLLECAARGELDGWPAHPRGALALIVLLDQLSRNIHRDSPLAFAQDARARRLTLDGLERGQPRTLPPVERWFYCMPLVHAEDLGLQDRALVEFRALAAEAEGGPADLRDAMASVVAFALRHREVIARFGRFAHRNALLGRATTPQEAAWLAAHPGGF
jgi:uncharacterized protein (DUF924 family)